VSPEQPPAPPEAPQPPQAPPAPPQKPKQPKAKPKPPKRPKFVARANCATATSTVRVRGTGIKSVRFSAKGKTIQSGKRHTLRMSARDFADGWYKVKAHVRFDGGQTRTYTVDVYVCEKFWPGTG
jgi:hypothetical protein